MEDIEELNIQVSDENFDKIRQTIKDGVRSRGNSQPWKSLDDEINFVMGAYMILEMLDTDRSIDDMVILLMSGRSVIDKEY